jgi:hypothetical protein
MLNFHNDVFMYYILKVPGSFSIIPVLLAEASYVCVLWCVTTLRTEPDCSLRVYSELEPYLRNAWMKVFLTSKWYVLFLLIMICLLPNCRILGAFNNT